MHKAGMNKGRGGKAMLRRLPLAAAIYLAMATTALAQEAPTTADNPPDPQRAVTLGTVTVTAQKREENLQTVPVSIQAVGQEQLEQHDVASFNDYAKLIPSLSYGTAGGGVFSGPGFLQVYMRGVASGGDGNHSGSQPSVGVYLDEQPITTITGALDVHMYDIARVEALAGPQGTLYGASSQSGTLRIITNKPDPTAYAASAAAEVSSIQGGGIGHVLEGMVNLPINDHSALRVVGWQRHDAGYVDNKLGSRTFPSSGITATNERFAKDDYNDADAVGARAALKIDLDDNWSITPSIMGQRQEAHGSTGYDPSVGPFEVVHNYPESSKDKWMQAALTVQGRIGNFDLTYAFGHLKRDVDSEADYSDYGFWYDTLAGYGTYFYDDDGALVNPSQYIQAKDGYTLTSHELRIASPKENRLRFVGGLFWQQQQHDIEQRYRVDDLASSLSVGGWADTIWLTEQDRQDRDEAVFGEFSFDLTDKLTATAGGRYFRSRNGLQGYYGFADGYLSLESFQNSGKPAYGEAACRAQFGDDRSAWPSYEGAPCSVFEKNISESGSLGRFNLAYKIDDKRMVYATWSEGYRPGGINRRGTLAPYQSDYLTNYEFGWKTGWADNRLIFNGAVFREDWKDFQFSYLGANGLTEIRNANSARIQGMELELQWAATYNFMLSGGLAFYDAKLTADYCGTTDANGDPETDCATPLAAKGTRLPITARVKGNITGRYTWDVGEYEAYFQGALFHQGDRRTDLRDAEDTLLGDLDGYTLFDLSGGVVRGDWKFDVFVKNVFDERTELTKFAECATLVCGNQPYIVSTPPRTVGFRISKDF
jgi:outer membrane receptor protein involved in Fe transport